MNKIWNKYESLFSLYIAKIDDHCPSISKFTYFMFLKTLLSSLVIVKILQKTEATFWKTLI